MTLIDFLRYRPSLFSAVKIYPETYAYIDKLCFGTPVDSDFELFPCYCVRYAAIIDSSGIRDMYKNL